MKLEEAYNLSRDKWFDRIKGECRSQAIKGLCIGVIIFLFFIAIELFWSYPEQRIANNCLTLVGCLTSGWMIMNNLWFLLRLNSMDSPVQLLHQYRRRLNSDRKATYLVLIGATIFNPTLWYDITNFEWTWIFLRVVPDVGVLALLIYTYYNDDLLGNYIIRIDEEIFDRLEELVEKK